MKYIFLIFCIFSICINSNANENKNDVSIETEFFVPINDNGEVLQIVKANHTGTFFLFDDYYNIYLKDSFISDPIFRKKCEGKISLQYEISSDSTKKSDPYNPWMSLRCISKSFYLERVRFDFADKGYCKKYVEGSAKNFQNEIFGYKKPVWKLGVWIYIDDEYNNKKRSLFIAESDFSKFYLNTSSSTKIYDNKISSWKFLPINFQYYTKILKEKNRSNYDSMPYFEDVSSIQALMIPSKKGPTPEDILMEKLLKQSSLPDTTMPKEKFQRLPIMCIDPNNHAERVDKNDWAIYTLLNKNNGDFFQYFFFEKELEYSFPLYFRDWALDYLAGVHICKKSTAGILLDPKEKLTKRSANYSFNPKKILFALNSNNKPWMPDPLPENKLTIPLTRCFYKKYPGRIFGSTCKVWELDIWQRVGYMLKKHPEGIYLVGYGTLLQAEETQTVAEEHAFIQKHGVLITPELYTSLETLRVFGSVFQPLDSVCGWSFYYLILRGKEVKYEKS